MLLGVSPPTSDAPPQPVATSQQRALAIQPQSLVLEPGADNFVKIVNRSKETVNWDVSFAQDYLNVIPHSGQLARHAQAMLVVSARQDAPQAVLQPQGWRGRVEIFSEQTVDYINVLVKPKPNTNKALLDISPECVDFGESNHSSLTRKELCVTNRSQFLVQWKCALAGDPQHQHISYNVSQPAAGLLNPGQQVKVAVTFRPVTTGHITASLDFVAQIVKVNT